MLSSSFLTYPTPVIASPLSLTTLMCHYMVPPAQHSNLLQSNTNKTVPWGHMTHTAGHSIQWHLQILQWPQSTVKSEVSYCPEIALTPQRSHCQCPLWHFQDSHWLPSVVTHKGSHFAESFLYCKSSPEDIILLLFRESEKKGEERRRDIET